MRSKYSATVTFRPSSGAEAVLDAWTKTGFSKSTIINACLAKYGMVEVKQLPDGLKALGLDPKYVSHATRN